MTGSDRQQRKVEQIVSLGHLAGRNSSQKGLWGEVGAPSKRVKIDFDTPWEKGIVSKLQLIGLGAALILFAGLVGGPKGSKPLPELLILLPIPLIFAAYYWRKRCTIAEYYLADTETRQLLFCREEHGRRSESLFRRFEQIACVGVSGVRVSTKGGCYYEYHVALIDMNAQITVMSDPSRAIAEMEKKGIMLGQLLGCRFEPTRGQTELVAQLKPGSVPVVSRRPLA